MVPATHFTDPLAVEAWDSWFRWRDDGTLRDVTIDATWWRVADTLAAVEGASAAIWAHRFADAFSRWRLLPDERLLQAAGTGRPLSDFAAPAAVLNVAAFVTAPRSSRAGFDHARFLETAAMAVRLLENAVVWHGAAARAPVLRIGIIGLADALFLLGLPYASIDARTQARAVAAALAEGCLRGTIDLASERGPADRDLDRRCLAARWYARGTPPGLIEAGLRRGVRHAELTAIDPHPRLALLANNVADALELAPGLDTWTPALRAAQRELRTAMQPWIDAPIRCCPDELAAPANAVALPGPHRLGAA